MYKVISSFWSKSSTTTTTTNKTRPSSETILDEDSWVFVSNTDSSAMSNSWIASPPLAKPEQSSEHVHHFNPIENLLIEHASMSVYEQIASKTRNRRQRKPLNDQKLDEQTEDEDDEEDDRPVLNHQQSNVNSIYHRNPNQYSTTTLDSSTSSLLAHHRHLNRLQQRRKRSKLTLSNSTEESKQVLNKANVERARLRSPKIPPVQQTDF